jgi:hypothetical protein
MAVHISRVEYYYASTEDRPGATYQILHALAEAGVNMLAFSAIPVGPSRAQLTLFPAESDGLLRVAPRLGLSLSQPQRAILVEGDDELGALGDVHRKLYDAKVNVFASSGVTAGQGRFGYLLYVRPEDYERAVSVLGI